jgi:hypothetical protein
MQFKNKIQLVVSTEKSSIFNWNFIKKENKMPAFKAYNAVGRPWKYLLCVIYANHCFMNSVYKTDKD